MLSSITPLGERGRRTRWGITVTAYLLGSTLAGSGLGALLGTLGSLLPRSRPSTEITFALVAAAAVLGAVWDGRAAGRALPSWRRQVDEDWLNRYRGWVYGLGFGLQLGLGVVTIVTSSTVYAAWLLALLAGSWPGGVAVGAAFGLSRALPVLALGRVVDATSLTTAHRRLQRWAPRAGRSAVLTQVGLAAAALVVVGTA